MRARRILDARTVLTDGRIIQRTVWQLPRPTADRPHGLKFRLYCGKGGQTIVRYDNESGKGAHRHVGPEEVESTYEFISLTQLLQDFFADVEELSGVVQ